MNPRNISNLVSVVLFLAAWALLALPRSASAQDPSPSPADPKAAPAPAAPEAPKVEQPHTSGFLDPYPEFKKGEKDFDYVWVKDGVDFSKYDKLLVDPVVFFFKDDAKYKGIHAEELAKLSQAFNKAFSEALHGAYPIVDQPGPGVLHIRAALTELVPNKPAAGALFAIAPGGSVAYAVLPDKYNNIGAATIEVEFLDSQTGERLAAGIDRRSGKKTEVMSSMKTWGHVEKAFKVWAEQFRTWFDEKHGKGPAK
jgi:hypothetical protein